MNKYAVFQVEQQGYDHEHDVAMDYMVLGVGTLEKAKECGERRGITSVFNEGGHTTLRWVVISEEDDRDPGEILADISSEIRSRENFSPNKVVLTLDPYGPRAWQAPRWPQSDSV